MVEYQPTAPNDFGVFKLISRIKAEEELWNKVVDEIFGLDSLVKRDKQLRHLSHYVKDIFGIKIVVGSPAEATALHNYLTELSWSDEVLHNLGAQVSSETASLDFVETKNYLTDHEKGSGWEAIKSVVLWNARMFEIQIQPLANFWSEREYLTRESHAGFKSRREDVRLHVAERIPLFRFYQSLLRWLFQNPEAAAPVFPGISVAIAE
jgi:ppGpp synthetase/RelA/SpoT-type nucleotidyltranferase